MCAELQNEYGELHANPTIAPLQQPRLPSAHAGEVLPDAAARASSEVRVDEGHDDGARVRLEMDAASEAGAARGTQLSDVRCAGERC